MSLSKSEVIALAGTVRSAVASYGSNISSLTSQFDELASDLSSIKKNINEKIMAKDINDLSSEKFTIISSAMRLMVQYLHLLLKVINI